MHALSGRYLRSETFANSGVSLEENSTYEDLLDNIAEVTNMDAAEPLAVPGNINALFKPNG